MTNHFFVLKKGDEISKGILDFCRQEGISFAYFSGLGAVSAAEISYYDMEKKEYLTKKFEEDLEITNITGNVAFLEGKHALHAHITLSDRSYMTVGGHLKSAVVSGTCEVFLVKLEKNLVRRFDSQTGLNLIK